MRHSSLLTVAIAFVLSSVGCREEPTGLAGDESPSLAATTSTQQLVNHIAVTRFVSCANGGVGEDVFVSGDIHIVVHVTLDGSGGAHFEEVHNPQGVSGTGLTTGAMYRGVGGTLLDASNVQVGEEHTSVRNMMLIGQGPDNNLILHATFHVTVLADGTVTAFHDNLSVTCR
jgi:hypothetical protein